jgi:NADH-quinone oxidoreductase subunit L
MPITWITSLLGSLALIGTPFFSGFYSKDSIIEAVHASDLPGAQFAYFAVAAGVFVTAFYSFRMYFLVFHGKERFRDQAHAEAHGHDGHHHEPHEPHESPWVVTAPLLLLAIPSVVIGFLTIQPMLFGELLADAILVDGSRHGAPFELFEHFHGPLAMAFHGFITLPFWLALAGVATAYVFYLVRPDIPAWFARTFAPLVRIMENKYYMDWINENLLAPAARGLGRGLWRGGDVAVIDGVVIDGSARLVGRIAQFTRLFQTGYLYHYALVMIVGVVALMSWFVWQYRY